jgi:hypothetical protein
LAATGLAVFLVLERQACRKLDEENAALRRQLGGWAELTAKNLQLSNLLGQAGTNSVPDPRLEELARLRSEVAAMRQQSNDVETLRADTRVARAALDDARKERWAGIVANRIKTAATNNTGFVILGAQYGTDQTNLDVTEELTAHIRGGSLKTIAGSLKAHPLPRQSNHLTVVYQSGGVAFTNDYLEGGVVALPELPP